MTQTQLDDAQTRQYLLFELDAPHTSTTQVALLPELATVPPAALRRSKGKRQASATTIATARTAAPTSQPQRLHVEQKPPLPELSPLVLARIRLALFQTLADQARTHYQTLAANQPMERHPILAPERFNTAAELLAESPALVAAVSLLALGTNKQVMQNEEHSSQGDAQ